METLSLGSLEESVLADFVLAKESVFWEPFDAGPLEVRERRVGGIFVFISLLVRYCFL